MARTSNGSEIGTISSRVSLYAPEVPVRRKKRRLRIGRHRHQVRSSSLSYLISMTDGINTEANNPESEVSVRTASVQAKEQEEGQDLKKLLLPNVRDLPAIPPSAVESNFVRYFALDFLKPGHDQYVYRHANGLCVIGLAPSHIALKDKSGITAVDFNVGKSDRSGMQVTGKRKKNAQHFESNTALCKVCTNDVSYIVRCCVKGSLLEVNDRLIKQPDLLNTSADREGYVAIIMPKQADWLKVKSTLVDLQEYKKWREAC